MTARPRVGFTRATTPAFAIGGLGWEPNPRKPDTGWINVPFGGWACFQCGARFHDVARAQIHFGGDSKVPPLCVLVADFVGDVREKHVRAVLYRQVLNAVFDPGKLAGERGTRTLVRWQTDAVMKVLEAGMEGGEHGEG